MKGEEEGGEKEPQSKRENGKTQLKWKSLNYKNFSPKETVLLT